LAYKLLVLFLTALLTSPSFSAEANLSWTEPTQNEDGSPLTDLTSYDIWYGTQSGVYDNVETLLAPATAYTVAGLPDIGTFYFAAKAVNSQGVSSVYSNEATRSFGSLEVPGPVTDTTITWREPQVMAISFIGAGTVVSHAALLGTTGIVLTPHASTLTDDLMIAFQHRNDEANVFDDPPATGWTMLATNDTFAGEDMNTAVGYKVATSDSEGAATFTHGNEQEEEWAGVILTFRGVDTTTPIDTAYIAGHFIDLSNKESPNTDAFATLNVTTDQACVIAFEAVSHDDITSNADPANYTNAVRAIGTSYPQRQLQVWYRLGLSTGDETPPAAAYTSSLLTAESHQYTIALRPAAAGGGAPENFLTLLGVGH